MSSYEVCIDELVQDFMSSFESEWSAENRELAEQVIAEAAERFEDGYRKLAEVDGDQSDEQELIDFWKEVEEEARLALKADSLI